MKPKLHYFNIPISAEDSDLDNPASIIRSIFKPGKCEVRMVCARCIKHPITGPRLAVHKLVS